MISVMACHVQSFRSRITHHASLTCPFRMNVAALWMIYALIGVRAEVIALRLRQILRQVRRAIAVEISQARAHGWYGDAHPYSRLHGQPPVRLRRFNPVVELVVK